jgi:hypothetical protein
MRKAIASATRLPSGLTLVGVRHCDSLMRAQCKASNQKYDITGEGFVDQFSLFMSRTEAWTVATTAGQVIRRVGNDHSDGGTLYSENLW